MNDQVKETIRFIVRALSVSDVQSLLEKGLLNLDEVDGTFEAIRQYGNHLIDIPSDGWSLVDVYFINGQKEVYDIDVPLWTKEEGRSDLMLKIHVNHGTIKILDILVP